MAKKNPLSGVSITSDETERKTAGRKRTAIPQTAISLSQLPQLL
jgi:hypothetical protein